MNPTVLAALVTAASALALGIYQALTQRRGLRDIEQLKAQLERQRTEQSEFLKAYVTTIVEGREAEILAYKQLLHDVQILRDHLADVLRRPKSFGVAALRKEVEEEIELVLHSFATNQTHFGVEDGNLAHTLKNRCRDYAESVLDHHRQNQRDHVTPVGEGVLKLQSEVADLQAQFRVRANHAANAFVRQLQERIDAKVTDG